MRPFSFAASSCRQKAVKPAHCTAALQVAHNQVRQRGALAADQDYVIGIEPVADDDPDGRRQHCASKQWRRNLLLRGLKQSLRREWLRREWLRRRRRQRDRILDDLYTGDVVAGFAKTARWHADVLLVVQRRPAPHGTVDSF